MSKPNKGDYGSFYEGYVSKVDTNNLQDAIVTYSSLLLDFYTKLPEEKANYQYSPEKWSLKDLLQHIIDTERIMSYRLLRIARNDKTPLPGFEENDYASAANAKERSFNSLKEEFAALRKSTDLFIQSLNDIQLSNIGIASGTNITANAIGYIIFGHLLHHKKIIEERYL